MSKILVTGAGGFIGSHLVEKLVNQGYNVKAFLKYNSRNYWGWLEDSQIKNDIEIITGDIRDYDSVYKALTDSDSVFHLAALIGIPYSYISPLAYIKTNVEGTYNILESSKERKIQNIILTSTSETYGTAKYVPIDEEHPLVGQSPYAASKISADQLSISFYRSFNLPIKIVRPFNTYGPRQSNRAFIPTVITQILSGENKIKIGNIKPTRDFTYINDTVNGFIEILKSNKLYGEVTNIGTGTEISIKETAQKIFGLMNVNAEIITNTERVRPEYSEVERLLCNNTKLLNNTKWKVKYKLEDGLKETIGWFKDNMNHYKPHIYNV